MDEDGQFILVASNVTGPPPAPDTVNQEFEAENRRLAEEEARIERKRQELEQLKALIERKKKLETENQRLEEEKLKLASIPKDVTTPRISLRKKPMKITNAGKITDVLLEYDFFERSKNSRGAFENDLIDNKNETVTDRATGLMWQKSGSSKALIKRNTKAYVKRLNKERFAGHSDWRIPTIEELASLLTRRRINGVHMDPVFDNMKARCWSADKCEPNYSYYNGFWIISFKHGKIDQAFDHWDPSHAGGYEQNILNYVKAVRSDK